LSCLVLSCLVWLCLALSPAMRLSLAAGMVLALANPITMQLLALRCSREAGLASKCDVVPVRLTA
jgi:hypothetical protein